MKKFTVIMILLIVSSTLTAAMPAPVPKVVYQEDFNDGTYNTEYWTPVSGQISANADIDGVFYGDPGDDPQNGIGKLSLGTAAYTEANFDLYKLVVTDLGYEPNDLAKITFEFDLAQTNGTGASYRFNTLLFYGADSFELEASPEGDRNNPLNPESFRNANGDPNTATSFVSLDGLHNQMGAGNDGTIPLQRLNVAQWGWQRMRYSFNVDEYFTTKIYQDYDMNGEFNYVAYAENWHPDSGNEPWPYPEGISLMNRDGTVSWFIDNIKVQLDNPYVDWNKVLDADFDAGIPAAATTSGYWTTLGQDGFGEGTDTDPDCPWHAIAGKMAAAEPNAYFAIPIPATTPGELVALSFDVQQSNGSDLDFPVFFGFGDAQSNDYYVEFASPALTYSENSGAMIMMSDTPNGNGIDPFLTGNDDWWSFGAGVEGARLSTGTTHIDMIINPWEDYPAGSISVYFDGVLAATWTNFRPLYSFDEVFFGIRNNIWEDGISSYTPTWNFDNIEVYTRPAQCGDSGYNEYDFNQNCVVDLADFATFAQNWLECTDPQDITCFQ